MFYKRENSEYKVALEGVKYKTLTWGQKSLLSEFKLAKGSIIPTHKHPHEQTGYLISGRMRFDIAGEKFLAEPGDSWCIHGNIVHSVNVLEDTVVIEIFSPVREEYLP